MAGDQTFLDQAKDPLVTLNSFSLDDLAPYKRAQSFSQGDSQDYRVFYVGPDDVHSVLKYLLSRCSRSLKMNMFGYDDDELNAIIAHLVESDHVFVQGTLDKSQSAGAHEKGILAGWSDQMRASFAIGESSTHQISHTKGGVVDGVVAWEGSTNWSDSGEGTFKAAGRKAQNNTLTVHVNSIEVVAFVDQLDEEHSVALAQMGGVTPTTVQAAAQ